MARRILDTNSPDSANVAAFTTNAIESGATAIRIAPMSGPITTPRSCTVCSNALAAPSRVSPTRRGRRAIAAGRSAVPAAEVSVVSAITSTTCAPAATTPASVSISTQRMTSPVRRILRRSNLSATAPPMGPSTTYGISRQTVAAPTHAGDPVAL